MMMILLTLPIELRLLLTKQIWRLCYYLNSQLEAAEIIRLLGQQISWEVKEKTMSLAR